MSEKIIKPLAKPQSITSEPTTRPQPIVITNNPKLTFSDGLNFGCGFWVAGLLFYVALLIGAGVLIALFR